MRNLRRLSIAALAIAALSGGVSSSAAADGFGQDVATCAHELGQRPDAPTVACTHHGMTLTFANFGAMVVHMHQMG